MVKTGTTTSSTMITYDETRLIQELATLPPRLRLAFATAAATRQLPCYDRYAPPRLLQAQLDPASLVTALWQKIRAGDLAPDTWQATLDKLMAVLEQETRDWRPFDFLAEDTLVTVAYAIRCLLDPNPQEAAWAARVVYEAADQAAIRLHGEAPSTAAAEAQILAHPFIQRTLGLLHEDLASLKRRNVEEVFQRACTNPAFTEAEFARFDAFVPAPE